MKTPVLLAVTAVLAAASANARECEVDLHYGVTLESKQVLLQDGSTVFVLANGELRRDGKTIALSGAEKQKLRDYEAGLRQLVPQVSAVTREALAIAGEATEFAFSTLLGPDHESVKNLRGKFANLSAEIGKRVDDQHLPAKAMSLRDDDWDVIGEGASIGWSVADASFSLVGKAMRAAFDEDYARQWESELEQMEEELDKRVEARAGLLEEKAEALCDNLEELEDLESVLAKSNKALTEFDLIRAQ